MSTEETTIALPFATSHAFIIGIDAYEQVSPLSTAVNDAKLVARVLAEEHGYQVHPPLLNATRAEMIHLLEKELPELVKENDRILFYFAGHGIALDSDDDPRGYLVPADAEPGESDTLVPMDDYHQAISNLPCDHGLIVLDCCFAGSFRWSSGYRDVVFDLPGIIYEERFYQYARDPAWQVITSSASDQKAVDILSNHTLGMRNPEGVDNSPFAQAFVEGIAGAADTIPKDREDGVITATELYSYLRDRVEDETTKHGKRQSPSMFALQAHNKGQYIFLNPRHRLNLPPIPRRNPYMGLLSYDEKDSAFYYGRERVVTALEELIVTQSLVVVSGASGTGKSSVIKAGLIPRLRQQGWRILPVLRPGQEPMKNLQIEFPDLGAPVVAGEPTLLFIDQYEELITQCLDPEDRAAFEAHLSNWLESYPDLHLILSVRSDFEPQFEEATLASWWRAGRYFVPAFSPEELREVIIKPTAQEVLFFEPESLVDKLIDAVNQAPGALPLLSFTLSELYHSYLNSGRTNRAFTLEDYEQLGGVIGSLRARANTIYDTLDESHQDSMRELMLRMVSMEGGELSSRRVTAEDLVFNNKEKTECTRAVAQLLVEARLVSSGRDNLGRIYYEPGHDALVSAWARLWEWIKSEGEAKHRLMYKLSLAIADYQEQSIAAKAKKYLWNDDPRLDLLTADLQTRAHGFNTEEEGFLRKSLRLRKQNTRRRRTVEWITFLVLLAVTCSALLFGVKANVQKAKAEAAVGISQKQTERAMKSDRLANAARKKADLYALAAQWEADTARMERQEALRQAELAMAATRRAFRQANISQAHQLANRATRLAEGKHYTSALHNALAAYQQARAPQPLVTYLAFQEVFNEGIEDKIPIVVADLNGHESNSFRFVSSGAQFVSLPDDVVASFSPRGDYLLSHSQGNVAKLWDGQGNLLAELNRHTDRISSASFAPDGRSVLTSSWDGTAKLWDLNGQLLADLKGHTAAIVSASFSSDGSRVLTYARGQAVKIWDLAGNLLADLNQHRGPITAASFSPDGQYVLTGSGDRTAMLWNSLGNMVAELAGHTDAVLSANFSPDGRYIVTTSKDATAKIWNLNGDLLADLTRHTNYVLSAKFAPDSRRLLTRSRDQTVKLWNLEGKLLADLNEHTGAITTASFSPNGLYVVTGAKDSTAKVWDWEGKRIANLAGHSGPVTDVAFSPNNLFLVTSSADKTAKLWNRQGVLLANLDEHTRELSSVRFSPDGYRILTTSQDLTAKLWELKPNPLAKLAGHTTPLTSTSFSPDGSRVLTRSKDKTARLWDRAGQLVAELNRHAKPVEAASFSPVGGLLLTRSGGTRAMLWDQEGNWIADLDRLDGLDHPYRHTGNLTAACFSPDGQYILTSAEDGKALLWDTSGQPIARMIGHAGTVITGTFSPNSQLVLTYSTDQTAKLWNLKGELQANLDGHTDQLTSASFSPNGRYLLTSSVDRTAKLWNLKGQLLVDLTGHFQSVTSACFSPNSRYLLTGSEDQTARLWDLRGQLVAELRGHTKSIAYAGFSPDGRHLLTYTKGRMAKDRTAKLWDLSGRLIADLDQHTDQLTAVTFSASGDLILTSSWDKTAKLWNLNGQLLADLDQHGESVTSACFSPDGRSVLTGSSDKTAILWPLPADYANWVEQVTFRPLRETQRSK